MPDFWGQFCHCGTQPGFQHDRYCPFPLYVEGTDEEAERWQNERAAKIADSEAARRLRDGQSPWFTLACQVLGYEPKTEKIGGES